MYWVSEMAILCKVGQIHQVGELGMGNLVAGEIVGRRHLVLLTMLIQYGLPIQLDMDNTRMSCEELLSMTRSLHESNSSNHIHEDHEADLVCQRCLLNNLSNRALLGEGCQHENNEFRLRVSKTFSNRS